MPVTGVFTVADVGDHQQLRHSAFGGRNRALHNPGRVIRARRRFVLRIRQSKQDHATDPQTADFFALTNQAVNRHLELPRHGADFAAHSLARANEQRQDELRRVEPRLAHQ